MGPYSLTSLFSTFDLGRCIFQSFLQIDFVSRLKEKTVDLFVCLFVFYVPSTARSFRDGTPIYCPLQRTRSSVNTPFQPGIEPRAIAWRSITLPLRHASSLKTVDITHFSSLLFCEGIHQFVHPMLHWNLGVKQKLFDVVHCSTDVEIVWHQRVPMVQMVEFH